MLHEISISFNRLLSDEEWAAEEAKAAAPVEETKEASQAVSKGEEWVFSSSAYPPLYSPYLLLLVFL